MFSECNLIMVKVTVGHGWHANMLILQAHLLFHDSATKNLTLKQAEDKSSFLTDDELIYNPGHYCSLIVLFFWNKGGLQTAQFYFVMLKCQSSYYAQVRNKVLLFF